MSDRDGADADRDERDPQGEGRDSQGDGEQRGQDGQQGQGEQQGQESEQRGRNEQQEQQGGGQQQGQQERDDRQGGEQPSTVEKVLTAVSIAFTLLLFGFVAWNALQSPDATRPRVEVVGVERLPGGEALVRVEFSNPGDKGLLSATVQVDCAEAPPTVTFSNVPAGGVQRATLVCPPGTRDPEASVNTWIPT